MKLGTFLSPDAPHGGPFKHPSPAAEAGGCQCFACRWAAKGSESRMLRRARALVLEASANQKDGTAGLAENPHESALS